MAPKDRHRKHLPNQTPLKQWSYFLDAFEKCQNVVVVAGAGISTAAGIPDFRSQKNSKALFDISVYNNDRGTAEFHKKIRDIFALSSTAEPTAFHKFLADLARKDRLLRLYTQNIDCIDTRLPGLATSVPLPDHGPWPRTIQLHGSLDHVICQKCREIGPLNPDALHGPEAPSCPSCMHDHSVRMAAGKRSHGIGKLRPRITLYGENHPFDCESIGSVVACDLQSKPDALIVVGTTLHLPGVRSIVRDMAHTVAKNRRGLIIWINREPPSQSLSTRLGISWDFIIQSSSDEVAGRLLR